MIIKVNHPFLFFMSLLMLFGCNKDILKLKKNTPAKVVIFEDKIVQIPKEGFIIINEEVSIYEIANRFRLIPNDIIEINELTPPYKLHKGQKLFLPYPLIHSVIEGDTLSKLSVQYAVKINDILELNSLNKSKKLFLGQKIKIPLKRNFDVVGLVIREKKLTLKKAKNLTLKIKDSPKFIWPTKGKLVRKFGTFSDGKQHYDGIDILVNDDEKVIASYDGKVAFVGSRIKSFGNMIILKHDKEWISAYSKISLAKVKEGEVVKKGQIIALIKKNNSLHFQIRKSRNPVNPETFLN